MEKTISTNTNGEISSGLSLLYSDSNSKSSRIMARLDDTGHEVSISSSSKTITAVRSAGWGYSGTFRFSNIQLEEGTVETAYEPYYVATTTPVTQTKNHTLTAIWE